MGFWTVESFGSLSKKELAKNPVCSHCGKPAKFVITLVEHDYEGDLTDAESQACCRACASVKQSSPFPRNTRQERRRIIRRMREERARRNALAYTNPDLLKRLDELGVSV